MIKLSHIKKKVQTNVLILININFNCNQKKTLKSMRKSVKNEKRLEAIIFFLICFITKIFGLLIKWID